MPRARAKEMVLAGDLGGTHARLRLYDRSGGTALHEAVLPSRGARSLAGLLRGYLAEHGGRVVAAVLAVAGPVVDGVARLTNLPWVADRRALSRDLGIPKVLLINDLAAGAVGCARLGRRAGETLGRGAPVRCGNIAVIAAGTGLGEALLVWDGERHVPTASEGGHCDFAPSSAIEVELLAHLRRRQGGGHVSVERAVSGPGLGAIYDFFAARFGEPQQMAARLAEGDRNARIAESGLARETRAAARAVDLFARLYGAEAGNLALKGLALGGVFVLGSIGATLLPSRAALFLEGLRGKGRMAPLLARIPVTVVTDPFVGLGGAGELAVRLAAS